MKEETKLLIYDLKNKNTKNIANIFAASQNVTAINFNIDHAILAIIIHIIIKMVNAAIAIP